jgi:hypothetical protein
MTRYDRIIVTVLISPIIARKLFFVYLRWHKTQAVRYKKQKAASFLQYGIWNYLPISERTNQVS